MKKLLIIFLARKIRLERDYYVRKKYDDSGKKAGGEKKRNGENDIKFAFEFENLIKSANIC